MPNGQIYAIFRHHVAAAEAAVGLAIVLAIFQALFTRSMWGGGDAERVVRVQ